MSDIEPLTGWAPDTLTSARELIDALDARRQAMVEVRDVDGLAVGAVDLGALIDDLSIVQRQARVDIATLLVEDHEGRGRPKRVVPGLGEVKVPGGMERKNWESEKLLRRVVAGTLYDTDTGERIDHGGVDETVEAVMAVLSEVLPLTGSLAWRVGSFDKVTEEWTGLKGRGIDPSDYCDEVEKAPIAQLPKRVDQSAPVQQEGLPE